jgi:hypothetical protein
LNGLAACSNQPIEEDREIFEYGYQRNPPNGSVMKRRKNLPVGRKRPDIGAMIEKLIRAYRDQSSLRFQ